MQSPLEWKFMLISIRCDGVNAVLHCAAPCHRSNSFKRMLKYRTTEPCSSSDERDSRTHLLSGKYLPLIFCDAFDGYNFLINKFMGPSISLSGRGLSRNGPEDEQVVLSVNAFLCMSYAHEGVWAGADLDEDPQPTMETVEPQQMVSSTGGFSEAV